MKEDLKNQNNVEFPAGKNHFNMGKRNPFGKRKKQKKKDFTLKSMRKEGGLRIPMIKEFVPHPDLENSIPEKGGTKSHSKLQTPGPTRLARSIRIRKRIRFKKFTSYQFGSASPQGLIQKTPIHLPQKGSGLLTIVSDLLDPGPGPRWRPLVKESITSVTLQDRCPPDHSLLDRCPPGRSLPDRSLPDRMVTGDSSFPDHSGILIKKTQCLFWPIAFQDPMSLPAPSPSSNHDDVPMSLSARGGCRHASTEVHEAGYDVINKYHSSHFLFH